MKRYVIDKTDTGYTLRTRKGEQIQTACVMIPIMILGLLLLSSAVKSWIGGGEKMTLWIFLLGLMLLVPSAGLLCRRIGARMDFDEEGVHLRRSLAPAKYIAWQDVRDWGVAYKQGRYGHFYYFYISSEVLKPTVIGVNKRLPLTHRRAVYINILEDNVPDLLSSGLLAYCRLYLGEDENGARYVPMFAAQDGLRL